MTVSLIRHSGLGVEDVRLVERMLAQLRDRGQANDEAEEYYEGRHVANLVGMSTPPAMRNVHTVAGWPGTVVDVLDERLDWLGWYATDRDDFGLSGVYQDNQLDVESGASQLDALIYGVGFVVTGKGADGEPDVLVTVESPKASTGLWNRRTRRLDAGISVLDFDEGGLPSRVVLRRPDGNQTLARSEWGGWRIEDADDHKIGRTLMVPMANRARASRDFGRSEITRAVRYYTDTAARTLLGMEVNREFYSAPQRYMMGASPDMFQNADGSQVTPWQAIMGRVWMAPRDDEGELPQVGEFSANSPAPYLEQVRGLSLLLAAEAGLPATYLGFSTENPASADAIRAGEARLVKRAQRRQLGFDRSWLEVARLSLLVRDGEIPAGFESAISSRWVDPATPTKAATADAGQKMLTAVPWLAETEVGLELIGMDSAQVERAQAERRRAAAGARLDALLAGTQEQPAPVSPNEPANAGSAV